MKFLNKKPQRIFLIDGLGALASLVFLFLITILNPYFGMPVNALLFLTAFAASIAMYSLGCYFFVKSRFGLFLKITIGANILYAGITFGLVAAFRGKLTALGTLYFDLEVLIIIALVFFEIRILTQYFLPKN
jgi:hypothetical protein